MTKEQLQDLDAMAKPRSDEAVKKAEERKKQREDKDLLLCDLCARLPYCVKIKTKDDNGLYTLLAMHPNKDIAVIGLQFGNVFATSKIKIDEIKPYLRPLSSMTEGEKKELNNVLEYQYYAVDSCMCEASDWLNAHHFDYRRLIEKGLAISTNVFNPYKD